jgi:hypothetical protein
MPPTERKKAPVLYVNPRNVEHLQRVQVGWRQLKSYTPHFLPFDSPGAALGDWELASDVAGLFEVLCG